MHLRACSGQDRFAVNQTYVGRRPDQLHAVGSYSGSVALEFSFDNQSSLRDTCQHVFKQTMKIMASADRAVATATRFSNVAYELNDFRPITRPSVTSDEMEVVLCDLFFIVGCPCALEHSCIRPCDHTAAPRARG